MKRLLTYLFMVLSLQVFFNASAKTDDTDLNTKICKDIGLDFDTEKFFQCKSDLTNLYNEENKVSKLFKEFKYKK